MEIGINLAAEALERNIREIIKGSCCPATIVCGVLRDILTEASAEKKQAIERELQELKERQKAVTAAESEHEKGERENGKPAEADHKN